MIKQHDTLVAAALSFAIRAHHGQLRTGTQFPFATHPVNVGQILRLYTEDPELEMAGYLHDVIEDCPSVEPETISDLFGQGVLNLVMAVTRRQGHNMTREISAEPEVAVLKCADVLDNARDTLRGLDKGHDVWSRFSAGRKKLDYWKSIYDATDMLRDGGQLPSGYLAVMSQLKSVLDDFDERMAAH